MNKAKFILNQISLPTFILLIMVLVFFARGYTIVAQQKPEASYRITIIYDIGKYDSIKVEKLNIILPLTVKEKILKTGEAPTGHFFEILDEKGEILFRSNMEDPTLSLLEYEDPEKPGKIKSQLVKHDSGVFSFLTKAPIKAKVIKFGRVISGQENIPIEKRSQEVLGTFNLTQG